MKTKTAKANFNTQSDALKFETLAPTLSANKDVKSYWGVLNVAQVSQQNGELEGCWCWEYLLESFCGTTGYDNSREVEQEVQALWNAAV